MSKKPKKLESGDTVAIVSPSWGGPSVFPGVYESGLEVLKEWGLNIKEYPSARMESGFLHANPKVRADDINAAFADPEVKAVLATIGGDDSIRILPFLDTQLMASNPKILLGYSDTTTLHVVNNLAGSVSFYGPSIMAGFSQMNELPASFKKHVYEMLFNSGSFYEYQAYEQYCNGYPDWSDAKNHGKTNALIKNDGWHWIQGKTKISGELFGGCIEVLEMMKGTDFWPARDFWQNKIFFLETSEEKPPVSYIGHVLRNYGVMGVFDRISGIIFARACDYSDKEKIELEEKIISVVSGEFGKFDMPIVANFDTGHTDPQLIMPLGVRVEVDCMNKNIALVENWLSRDRPRSNDGWQCNNA